jgi:hypothetical protein
LYCLPKWGAVKNSITLEMMRYDEKAIDFDEFDDKIGRQLLMNWFFSIL